MRSAGTIDLPEELSERQRAALLNLLGDDDPAIYRTVRAKILSFGPAAAEWLRRAKAAHGKYEECHLFGDGTAGIMKLVIARQRIGRVAVQ